MKSINLFYFDNDMGEFDDYNPRKLMNNKLARDLVTILTKNAPYTLSIETISTNHNYPILELKEISNKLLKIQAIKKDNDKLALNFPFFNKTDINKISKIIKKEIYSNRSLFHDFDALKNVVLSLYPNINYKISLYHLICAKIFDGLMFDYLESKNILNQSFPKFDNRDYLIIGYENSKFSNKFNNNLLCSFNHARLKNNSLSSFGSANGNRVDFFRYFKLKETNNLYGKFIKVNNLIGSYNKETILENCLFIIKNIENNIVIENEFSKVLEIMGYIKNNRLIVPVFNDINTHMTQIYDNTIKILGTSICDSINRILTLIEKESLYSFKCEVNKDEIYNEIWHIYFGLLNNMLVKKKIVAKPKKQITQGRFLKCIYLNNDI